tara:strand:+ start:193 stop:420 length:228 start_codon:yes stop_codon:yes gene_type:complete
MFDLARKKSIKWSKALETGIKEEAYSTDDDVVLGEKEINQTDMNRLMQLEKELYQKDKAVKTMQDHILKLQEEKE